MERSREWKRGVWHVNNVVKRFYLFIFSRIHMARARGTKCHCRWGLISIFGESVMTTLEYRREGLGLVVELHLVVALEWASSPAEHRRALVLLSLSCILSSPSEVSSRFGAQLTANPERGGGGHSNGHKK